jgi:subtilisin family serine protease
VSLLAAAMLMPAPVAAASPTARSTGGFRLPSGELKKVDLSKIRSLSGGKNRMMVFVHLSGRPVASYQGAQLATAGTKLSEADKSAIRARLGRQQGEVRGRISATGARVQSAFTDVANGFRVWATGTQVRQIARLAGVTQISAVPLVKREDLQSADYIKAVNAWTSTGLTGSGIKVAVIDTGINYYHANFAGAGDPGYTADDPTIAEKGTFPTAKVVGGYDFVGDDYDPEGTTAQQTPHPDPDPLDCKDPNSGNVHHGSHVAGIAAGFGVKANGTTYTGAYTASAVNSTNFRIGPGIAPKASLYAYRVLSCEGGTWVVADAIERAVRDNVDVIKMSLGSDFGNPDTIDSIASNAAAEAGVVVVASAGNAGPSAYISGSPAVANRVISVGAVDGAHFISTGVIVDFEGSATDVGGSNMYTNSSLPVTGPMNVIVDGTDALEDGCEAADFAGVTSGDIVTIVRGTCAFADKRGNAQAAGAVAVVLVNNEDATIINAVDDPDHTIPMVSVNPSHEAELRAGDGLSTTLHEGNVENENFGTPAGFTSGGPARYSNAIKPDVMAPGVDVVSTDGATVNEGKSLGGTSMASPNVAGAAALVLQAHPLWTPAHVKGALVGTSNTGLVDPYTVIRSGAGVINVQKAMRVVSWAESLDNPGLSSLTFGYDAININRNGGDAYTESHSFRLQNTSTNPITYNLSNAPQTDPLGFVATLPSSVTVPARSSRTVTVTLSLSNAAAAALPDQAANDAPTLAVDGPSLYVPLNHVAGAILANPTTGGPGTWTIRVPWIVVPRGTSEMKANQKTPYTGSGVRSSSVKVKNKGVHAGNIDVFAWGLSDQRENQGSIDLRAAGVQSLPTEFCTGGDPDLTDRCLIFAINVYQPWQSGIDPELDVFIDIDNDDTPDFWILMQSYDQVFGPGDVQGVPIALILDIRAGVSLVDLWLATSPPNGSTALLPVLASELERTATDANFRYWVESAPNADGSVDPGNPVFQFDVMYTGSEPNEANLLAQYDAFDNPISQGDFWSVAPGAHANIPIWVDTSRYDSVGLGQKGWMFVNLEDPDGAKQADLVPVGRIN